MLNKFNSTCSYCGVGCGVSVSKDRDGHLDLTGNENYPSNQGRLCSKGMNLHHVVQDQSDRLLKPQMRMARNHPMKDVSWDQAIERSAAVFKTMIKKHGRDSVGLYVSGQLLTEEYYLANKLCKGFFGTNSIDPNSRLCMSSAVVGYKMTIGDDAPPISYDDIEESDCFFVAGANPAWCHPIIFRRLEAQLEANPDAKLIVVDPRRTQTAEMADLHLQIKPGSDVYLYNAIAALLFSEGYADEEFLANFSAGANELRDSLKNHDITAAAKQCAIAEEEIDNYYTTVAALSTDGTTYTNTKVALLGMHVVGIVENHPEFIWATFEHDDLAPNYNWKENKATSATDKLLFEKISTTGIDGITWSNDSVKLPYKAYDLFKYGVPRDSVGNFMNTSQEEPINFNNIQNINDCVKENLTDVWKNYFYNGSIWIDTDEMTPEQQTATINSLGGNIGKATPDSTSVARGSVNCANVTMETYTQTFKSSLKDIDAENLANCFSCHNAVNFSTNKKSPLYISHVFNAYLLRGEGKTFNEVEALKAKQEVEDFMKNSLK